MEIASTSLSKSKSVVPVINPASTSDTKRLDGISSIYELPPFKKDIFSSDTSNPITRTPASANTTASGRPTYPIPMIPSVGKF